MVEASKRLEQNEKNQIRESQNRRSWGKRNSSKAQSKKLEKKKRSLRVIFKERGGQGLSNKY